MLPLGTSGKRSCRGQAVAARSGVGGKQISAMWFRCCFWKLAPGMLGPLVMQKLPLCSHQRSARLHSRRSPSTIVVLVLFAVAEISSMRFPTQRYWFQHCLRGRRRSAQTRCGLGRSGLAAIAGVDKLVLTRKESTRKELRDVVHVPAAAAVHN